MQFRLPGSGGGGSDLLALIRDLEGKAAKSPADNGPATGEAGSNAASAKAGVGTFGTDAGHSARALSYLPTSSSGGSAPVSTNGSFRLNNGSSEDLTDGSNSVSLSFLDALRALIARNGEMGPGDAGQGDTKIGGGASSSIGASQAKKPVVYGVDVGSDSSGLNKVSDKLIDKPSGLAGLEPGRGFGATYGNVGESKDGVGGTLKGALEGSVDSVVSGAKGLWNAMLTAKWNLPQIEAGIIPHELKNAEIPAAAHTTEDNVS